MNRYPRTYAVTRGWRTFSVAIGLLLGLPAISGIVYFSRGREALTGVVTAVTISCAFALLSSYLMATSLRSKLILFEDRLELHDLFTRKVAYKSEIQGWRIRPTSPPLLVLINFKSKPQMKINLWYQRDDIFAEWMDSLRALDEEDINRSIEEIAVNPHFGASPDERLRTIERARRWQILWWSAGLSCGPFLAISHPDSFWIGLLAALPLIAVIVVWLSRGLFRFDEMPHDRHPTVAPLYLFPAMILGLRGTLDCEWLGWKGPGGRFQLSMAFGGMLTYCMTRLDPGIRGKRVQIGLLLAFNCIFGFGLTIETNMLLDSAWKMNFETRIVEKHISKGKGATYHATLAPWGPDPFPTKDHRGIQVLQQPEHGRYHLPDPASWCTPHSLVHR